MAAGQGRHTLCRTDQDVLLFSTPPPPSLNLATIALTPPRLLLRTDQDVPAEYRDLKLCVVFRGAGDARIIGEIQIHDAALYALKLKVTECRVACRVTADGRLWCENQGSVA